MRVAVIGAGPAGMTAALQLSRGGAQVSVYEASDAVGGMARTISLWGQRVDLGPHRFFSQDRRVNEFWLDLVGDDYAMVDRLTRIYYQGHFIDYPLKPLNALRKLGLPTAIACMGSYLREQVWPSFSAQSSESFESWIVSRFGRRLFEIFFKSYSEKLWGIPCDELSADFARQRIKQFSLREALLSAISPQRGKRHETLLDRFAYPQAGTGSVYEKMAARFEQHGGELRLQCPVSRVLHSGFKVTGVELTTGEREAFDHVVTTMPLSLLTRGLENLPRDVEAAVDGLRFRNTLLVYLKVESDALFDDQWLYIHAPELKIGRVTNFRNWVPQIYGQEQATILAAELWCNSDDDLWKESDANLVELVEQELRSTQLLNQEHISDGHVIRLPRCYPVYDQAYRQHLEVISNHFKKFSNLTPIGRYGSFKYVNQDGSILMGLLAAEKILSRNVTDLWSLSTDQEAYQESALITETGLVR